MKTEHIFGIAIILLVGAGLGVLFILPSQNTTTVADTDITKGVAESKGEPYKEIVNPSGFVNTDPITVKQFVGKKIILVDFLTYSCINCQRTFPYLNAWDEKYREQGLLIIGIHTPEFAFEKNIDNVREAMQKFGITHPIVLDNEYATWNAWGNRYWPRKYLIDIYGNVVYDHIGEGAYEETEMKIQELLDERAKTLGEQTALEKGGLISDAVASVTNSARSPETYFGSLRNERLGNGSKGLQGKQTFILPKTLFPNTLYLSGVWNMTPEYAEGSMNTSVFYTYNAREVYLVAEADTPAEIEIVQDGKTKMITVQESKLYTIVSNTEPGEHNLEIKIKKGNVRLYAFTFG